MKTPPNAPNIGEIGLMGRLRAAKITMPIGLVIFVGRTTAIATGERTPGWILLVLGILCPVVGMGCMYVALRRGKKFTHEMEARQRAAQGDLELAIRDYQQRHQNDDP
jgi:hypothetical protein